MVLQEIINRGGSKLEITRALLEAGVKIPIPRSTWKYYGQSLDSLLPKFQKMRKPVIVRGSHPNDYHGFIDVIPTIRSVDSVSQLEEAVKEIETTVASEDVKIHCEDWNQPYTPEVHILLQEQSHSPIMGTMIRHPHRKPILDIQYLNINEISIDEHKNSVRPWVYYATTARSQLTHRCLKGVTDYEIEQLIEMYETLENSGIIDSSYSQQMEFGLHPLFFFQARPFKKFEKEKNFQIPLPEKNIPYVYSNLTCFGITAPEGVELNFVVETYHSLISPQHKYSTSRERYGLIMLDKIPKSLPLNKRLGNMVAYSSPSEYGKYLLHENYRMMKKADFSLMGIRVYGLGNRNEISCNDLDIFKTARLFSNGWQAVIIPTQYL